MAFQCFSPTGAVWFLCDVQHNSIFVARRCLIIIILVATKRQNQDFCWLAERIKPADRKTIFLTLYLLVGNQTLHTALDVKTKSEMILSSNMSLMWAFAVPGIHSTFLFMVLRLELKASSKLS